MFTTNEMLACAERELRYRIRIYAKLVAEGKMSERQSGREIAVMGAIVEHFRALRDRESPELNF